MEANAFSTSFFFRIRELKISNAESSNITAAAIITYIIAGVLTGSAFLSPVSVRGL
jgi:hypothetical protein